MENFITWLSLATLDLHQITWDDLASLLEKIVGNEAVHPISNLLDLKRRLGIARHCFGYLHPAIPGHEAPCKYGGNLYMALFGLVHIVMSFIPNLHNMAWVSVVVALMSFTYLFVRLGPGIAIVISKAHLQSIVFNLISISCYYYIGS
ncbi:hypothetical protein JHK84_052488 [Glycine max]|nr:hypothetical protein JHK86_052448 [Glycine max]KAG5082450.1 hypothetical protein JHK84_052488 [Glycine max]